MPFPILLSLLFYLGTLSATQTAHGGRFMTMRWICLAAFTGVSLLFWLVGRIQRHDALNNHGAPSIIWVYLLATLASIATAQNQVFSGLRWLSHAMMIITFMFLLRGTFRSGTADQMISILKGITLLLLTVSFFMPAPPTVYENPYFRGAMGDSNSLGHIAMVCALLYFHGSIISPRTQWKFLQFGIALVALGILIASWARSSMVGFIIGLAVMNHFYGLTRTLLAKSAALLLVCLLLASPIVQIDIMKFFAKEGEKNEHPFPILAVIREDIFKKVPRFETFIKNRSSLWSEAWEGFKQKPLLGWGFGANKGAQGEWKIRPTSRGMVRDLSNDILFTLEGTGIIGFLAYIGLMISIFKQALSRQQNMRIRKIAQERLPIGGNPISRNLLARDHQHAIFYIVSISLFALFQTDGSAFSAGSLISAIFWISASAAGALRAEAVVSERKMNRVEQESPRPEGLKIRIRNPKWESRRYNL